MQGENSCFLSISTCTFLVSCFVRLYFILRINVRTGAGLDNEAFTQLPNGTQVEVTGTEGEWI